MPENFRPHIGKNVIETLTAGMYDNALFIYREYVQNAADQIDVAVENRILEDRDEGNIVITIDKKEKEITISDNATGIEQKKVLQFLGDVANSQKDIAQRKGFRGIGRLGGLGYCNKLIFETSYKGEPYKSIMTLDALQLKKIIQDKSNQADASAVISLITTVQTIPYNSEDHFFSVNLQNVTKSELLNISEVEKYLAMVAPVPFPENFMFGKEIKTKFKENNISIDEYYVEINEGQVFKGYKNNIVNKSNNTIAKWVAVDYFKINNKEGDLLALAWFGISDSLNKVLHQNNFDRGIRIKKGNISIGSENTLSKFFSEDRFNLYYIGEVHVFGPSFIPNARRDYFNDNNTCEIFEREIRGIFTDFGKLAHTSSDLHNRLDEIIDYQQELEEFQNKTFQNQADENHHKGKLLVKKDKAKKARRKVLSIKSQSNSKPNIGIIYSSVVGNKDLNIGDDDDIPESSNDYQPPTFSKLDVKESNLVLEIISIIEKELKPYETASPVINKIIEHFND